MSKNATYIVENWDRIAGTHTQIGFGYEQENGKILLELIIPPSPAFHIVTTIVPFYGKKPVATRRRKAV